MSGEPSRVSPVLRVMAAIKYGELVADLLALVVRIELARKHGGRGLQGQTPEEKKQALEELIKYTRSLLGETAKVKEDFGVDIKGIDFEKVRLRVLQACTGM